ncbi:MAG TPA: Minf_1886 family protein [Verrucomicrobiae bacterium]|nr:Minf_1886 family protein [Verrucomicrobiae bacterium]
MHEPTFEDGLDLILTKDSRYQRDGYLFVREALDHTQKAIVKENRGNLRHVSGQELLGGIREYALSQFGPMTSTVLAEWGIRNCQDFGEIVFNMVEAGLLAKTEKDSRDDFQNGYDFFEAFEKPFLPSHKLNNRGAAASPADTQPNR